MKQISMTLTSPPPDATIASSMVGTSNRDTHVGKSLLYLTVQDIIWINQTLTKKVHAFDYEALEQASYYQFAYGSSDSLVPQAGRFLSGFAKNQPFTAGNEATCFVAAIAFLLVNGIKVDLQDGDAIEWYEAAAAGKTKGEDAVAQIASPDEHAHLEHAPNVRASVAEVLARFPKTLEALSTSHSKIRRADD